MSKIDCACAKFACGETVASTKAAANPTVLTALAYVESRGKIVDMSDFIAEFA